jgi:hypothetical protein
MAGPADGPAPRSAAAWPAALGWLLRLIVATALVLVLAHFQGRTWVGWMLKPLAHTLAWAAPDFRVLQFGFMDDRNNRSVSAVARLEHSVVLNDVAIVPDGSPLVVGANVGTVLQPLLAAVVLLLAWPGGPLRVLLRLLLAAPLLAVVLALDTPLSMAAWLWFTQLQQHAPGQTSPLLWWNTFLNGGGRLALGLAAAALAIAAAGRLLKLRPGR